MNHAEVEGLAAGTHLVGPAVRAPRRDWPGCRAAAPARAS
jgi:hypothetical protein